MIKRFLGGIFLLFGLINSMQANSADSLPVIRCIDIDPVGNVTITWTVPNPANIPGTFFHYEIFAAPSLTGIYNSIGTVAGVINAWDTTSFRYYNGLINSGSYKFYVVIDTVGGSIPPYDIAESISLTATDIGNGLINLTWNPLRTPNLSSSTGWYKIFKEYPTGVWTFKDSTQNLTYQDTTVLFCNQWLSYKITIDDTSIVACTSNSTRDSVLIHDNIPPAPVTIDSVSVDPVTGNIVIGWEQDTSQDTYGYVIYEYFPGGILSPIDSTTGIGSTTYSFPNNNKLDSFIVVAKDSCGNLSSPSIIQTSIHLSSGTNPCNDMIILNWNKYINWADGVQQYKIMVSINGGPFNVLATVNSSTTTYSDTSLVAFTSYCYYIMAEENAPHKYTSRSNKVCITANSANIPAFGYIRTATVISSTKVRLDFYTDITAQVLQYRFLRAVNPTGPFDTLARIGPNYTTQFSFTDNTAFPDDTSYYYCYVVLDSCENITYTSNIARTILLNTISNADLSNTLTWNDYSGFLGGVSSYNIYRSIDNVLNPVPLATVPFGGANVYKDYVNNFVVTQGNFCYYIQAIEGPGNVYGFTDTSYSNTSCTYPDPILFVPSAFTPNGLNPEFKPVAGFANIHLYDLKIFSRWGDIIFESKEPSHGWDGTFKDNPVPEGVYLWQIVVTGSGDTQKTQAGTVTLIR